MLYKRQNWIDRRVSFGCYFNCCENYHIFMLGMLMALCFCTFQLFSQSLYYVGSCMYGTSILRVVFYDLKVS